MPPGSILVYIPISTDLGIFVGLGLREVWTLLKPSLHKYPVWLIRLMRNKFRSAGVRLGDFLEWLATLLPRRSTHEYDGLAGEDVAEARLELDAV